MRLFGKSKDEASLNEILRGKEPPALPRGSIQLLRLLRDPDTELDRISEALKWDPGLVVYVLRTVNSAAFGAARRIESVPHAVTMMGRSQLEQLVLGVAVKGSLPNRPAPGFEASRYWQAAFFRAGLARAIAGKLHPAEQARCFTAGLLQDMAIPILAHARPDDYGEVLEAWHSSPATQLHELEHMTFGWSHDVVGGQLASVWELPDSLAGLIRTHHDDSLPDSLLPPAIRLVALHRENDGAESPDAMLETARSMYGLEPDWLLERVEECREQSVELARDLV